MDVKHWANAADCNNTVYSKFPRHVQHPGLRVPTGKLFGTAWEQTPTNYTEADPSKHAPLQALLRWCYTCRLDLPYEEVPACLQLLQSAGLTELADEVHADMSSEGELTF